MKMTQSRPGQGHGPCRGGGHNLRTQVGNLRDGRNEGDGDH